MRFLKWIPARDLAVNAAKENMSALAWVDETCLDVGMPKTVVELEKHSSVRASAILVSVTVTGVDEDLAQFIQANADWPTREDPLESPDMAIRSLAQQFEKLGREVHEFVIHVVNRIVEWAYGYKGQFWLTRRKSEDELVWSRNNEFGTKVSVDGAPSVRWCTPGPGLVRLSTDFGRSSISRDDWVRLGAFVQGTRRASLTGELLSNALALSDAGYLRGAVTEAYSALEVALNEFAQSPRVDILRSPAVPPYTLESLKSAVDHLGVSSSVRHLLPLVLDPERLDRNIHARVCDLIDLRQNIVHSGQRTVDESRVRSGLGAASVLIEVLTS